MKMKQTILVLGILFAANTMAGERVILKDSKKVTTEVSTKTVRCSILGYGMSELKINIAALDGWTLFDHTNVRFGDRFDQPCMTAGPCKRFQNDEDGLTVDSVVKGNERNEKIVIEREVVESRDLTEEQGEKVCQRMLREDLKTTVGGVEFFHSRTGAVETLPAQACHI